MADFWTGPSEITTIRGMVDSARQQMGGYGKKQNIISLVDVTQTLTDDTTEELETRTLFIPTQGKNSSIFAASIRQAAGVTPKDSVLHAIEGKVVTFGVSYQDFVTKEGEDQRMTIYRVTDIADEAREVSEKEVLTFLGNKTPAEVMAGRGAFSGSDYYGVLATRAKTEGHFGDKVALVDGRYSVAT